jgi:hypothetical protein
MKLIQLLLKEDKGLELVPYIVKAINQVDENLSYKDLASAIATVIKDEYGTHVIKIFMEELHIQLGINEENTIDPTDKQAEYTEELRQIFNQYRPSIQLFNKGGKLSFIHRDNLPEEAFSQAMNWVQSKGYTVDKTQSDNDYECDDDRCWYPRIVFTL